MEILHFVVASLLVMAMWRFALKRSLLDDARDRLFDCRDQLRSTFVANGWSLDGEGYKFARDSINSHLRFIEDMSVWKIIFVQASLKDKPEVIADMQKKTGELFMRLPEGQAKYIRQVRQHALHAVIEFAIQTSVFFILVSVVAAPVVFLKMVCEAMTRGFAAFARLALHSLRHFGRTTHSIAEATGSKVADMFLDQSVVEQCSLENRRFA